MKKMKADQVKQLSRGRKMIFSLISFLLPFLFLILLEMILRISGIGDDLSLFINHPDQAFNGYKVVNPEIGKKYFQNMEYSAPAKDVFLKKKPNDVFRIFVLGSSTVVGFPYDNNLMFPRILSERLRGAYPDKKIEMVNTAITAINSFTLADFMPQILNENPDAILIYAGHNEFYGAFGAGSNEAVFHSPVLIRIHLKLMNYRVYQLVVKAIGSFTRLFNSDDATQKKRGTLMSRIVKNADITFGSKLYKEGINNYGQNLGIILSMAQKKNVKVFISDLVCNLRDIKPFKSIASGGMKGADEYYNVARTYEKENMVQKANENFILARDYDCIRFRASSDINIVIKKSADKYQADFVPTLDLFISNSPNGIIGDNLLTEHVHPNVSGEFLLSESFYKAIIRSGIIAADVNSETEKSYDYFRKSYGYSPLDSLIGQHRITNLKYHWPFRDETKEYLDYREIYKPKGLIDSLAFNVMAKQKMSLTGAHEYLAELYSRKNDNFHAFQEYNCLTKINPFWSIYFRKAGDCLLKMNDFPEALCFFERSTEYGDESFYAHFRAGEICMLRFDFERALVHFQKAQIQANREEKEKALIKIYQALCYLNRANEGQEIVAYFKKLNPNRPIQVPPKYYSYLKYIPDQIKKNVDEAQKLSDAGDYDKAVGLLSETLEIKETPLVFRLLAQTCYKSKDYEKSHQFLVKSYSEFKFDTQFLRLCFMTDLAVRKPAEAKNIIEQLLKVDPNYPEIPKFQMIIANFDRINPTGNLN